MILCRLKILLLFTYANKLVSMYINFLRKIKSSTSISVCISFIKNRQNSNFQSAKEINGIVRTWELTVVTSPGTLFC